MTVEDNVLAGRLSTGLTICSQDENCRLCQRPPTTRFTALSVTLGLLVGFSLERARKGLYDVLGVGYAVDRLPRLSIAWIGLEWQVSRTLSGLLDTSNQIKKSATSSSSIEEEEEIYRSKHAENLHAGDRLNGWR